MSRDRLTSSPLIIAALTAEVAPLVKRLGLVRRPASQGMPILYEGRFVTVAVTGMGAERAVAAMERLGPSLLPRRVIVTGFAGAADPALKIGDVLEPAVVIDQATGREHRPPAAVHPEGVLLTCDHPVTDAAEKARLREAFAADAVDMETAALADCCTSLRLPWTCIRAVSDTADESLPPHIDRLTHPSGRPNPVAAARYILTQPHHLPALIRLGRSASAAAHRLAETLHAAVLH